MTALRHGGKSAAAFRTISEVAEDLDVPQHVLRFWETKFSQVRPLKRGGGRRYYRPEDVELLRHIRDLLYTEGYTIKGVQRLLRESGGRAVVEEAAEGSGLTASQRKELKALKDELMALRELLKSVKS
jgi:DNA-binding transcriptional MerR regulator